MCGADKDDQKALGKPVCPDLSQAWNNYITPAWHPRHVDMKTMHMQNCINNCRPSGSQRCIRSVFYKPVPVCPGQRPGRKDYSSPEVQERKPSTLHKPITLQELGWLWQNVAQDTIKIILIHIYTGMRMSELAGIRMENVHLKEQYMIGGMKTQRGRNRTIPIADCILPLVKHFTHQPVRAIRLPYHAGQKARY